MSALKMSCAIYGGTGLLLRSNGFMRLNFLVLLIEVLPHEHLRNLVALMLLPHEPCHRHRDPFHRLLPLLFFYPRPHLLHLILWRQRRNRG